MYTKELLRKFRLPYFFHDTYNGPNWEEWSLMSKEVAKAAGGFMKIVADATTFDGVLEVEGEEIQIHKQLVGIASPYFKAIFSETYPEGQTSRAVISAFPIDTVRMVVDFMYNVDWKEDFPIDLFVAIDFFQVLWRDYAERGMGEVMKMSQAIEAFLMAESVKAKTIRTVAAHLISKHFHEYPLADIESLAEVQSTVDFQWMFWEFAYEEKFFETYIVVEEKPKPEEIKMEASTSMAAGPAPVAIPEQDVVQPGPAPLPEPVDNVNDEVMPLEGELGAGN